MLCMMMIRRFNSGPKIILAVRRGKLLPYSLDDGISHKEIMDNIHNFLFWGL